MCCKTRYSFLVGGCEDEDERRAGLRWPGVHTSLRSSLHTSGYGSFNVSVRRHFYVTKGRSADVVFILSLPSIFAPVAMSCCRFPKTIPMYWSLISAFPAFMVRRERKTERKSDNSGDGVDIPLKSVCRGRAYVHSKSIAVYVHRGA